MGLGAAAEGGQLHRVAALVDGLIGTEQEISVRFARQIAVFSAEMSPLSLSTWQNSANNLFVIVYSVGVISMTAAPLSSVSTP